MQRVQGDATTGNVTIVTGGVSSTTIAEGSFPAATVTVYATGTLNLASIFSDNGVTPKANPFTAASDGSWFFYAANGRYDIALAATNLARTLGDVLLDDPAGNQAFGGNVTIAGTLGVTGATTLSSTASIAGQLTESASIKLAEIAAPAAAAGFDVLWADSAAHRLKVENNGGGVVQLVQSGVDINTSDQVTVTHLASPLPTAQGGTAQNSTATFPTSGVVDTGTGTTNKLPKFTTGASGIIGDSSITDNGTSVASSLPLTLTTNHQVFAGNGTFTIPTGVTSCKVTITGAGGSGGGASNTNQGSGGGGGSTAIKWLTGLTPALTILVTVGTGGAAPTAGNNNGNPGSNSSISSGTMAITTVTGNPGAGGFTTASATVIGGGAGGTISTNGDINATGQQGFNTVASLSGGIGGGSIYGGGGTIAGGAAGTAGTTPGSGGGGGSSGGGNVAGGAGANGLVVFEWTN